MIELLPIANGHVRYPLPSSLLHDLRTPLNLILGYSELLVEQAREGGYDAFVPDLEKVRSAGQRMLSIIDVNLTSTGEPAGVTVPAPIDAAPSLVDSASCETVGHILVVDDDAGNRDVLSRLLKRRGYTVVEAANGLHALELLGAGSYDMVLLDILMPEMDGYEALRRIKGDERLQHIPIVMISALSEMESVARCIEMGADDYLPKPFNSTLLKARIGACLEKKRGRDREMQLYERLQSNYKRLQELERLRDDLTHMIIHDLRTPLTSVMAAMQTLDVVGAVNDAQREVMTIAVAGAESLLSMVNSLLDVEKMESGSMGLDLKMLSLPEVAETAVRQVASLADAKGLKLEQQIAPDLPGLLADEDKLRRTLVNLLGNAVKFTPSGGSVALEIRHMVADRTIEFCVRDTGEGIPPEAFERIFEKFGQVESREGGRRMSTGLGLTFCKLAVEAHKGHIGVESTPGLGSAFTFTIPLEGLGSVDGRVSSPDDDLRQVEPGASRFM